MVTNRPTVRPKLPPAVVRRAPARRLPLALRVCGRAGLIALWVLIPLLLLGAAGGGLLYVRLLNGPVQLKFLAEPIARAITDELPGMKVTVDDAHVWWTESDGLEFRLADIRFADASDVPVAVAPMASVRLSGLGLMSGMLSPSSIVLIEPRLVLLYSPERGLSLSLPREGAARGGTGERGRTQGAAEREIAVETAVSQWSSPGRMGGLFLKSIGVRNATLMLDRGGRTSALRIADGELKVDRKSGHVAARVRAQTATGQFGVTLTSNAPAGETAHDRTIRVGIDGLVPQQIADLVPDVGAMGLIEAPVSGDIDLSLGRAGAIESAQGRLTLGRGRIRVSAPGPQADTIALDSGTVAFDYAGATRRFNMPRIELIAGSSTMMLRGAFGPAQGSADGVNAFAFSAVEGRLGVPDLGVAPMPVEMFDFDGTVDRGSGVVDIRSIRLRAGGAEVLAAARYSPTDRAPLSAVARSGPMSIQTFKALWPASLAPGARAWVGKQVEQGKVTAVNFRLDGSAADAVRSALTVEATDVRLSLVPGLSPVEAPRLLVRAENGSLEVTVPEAVVGPVAARRLGIRSARFVAADVKAPGALGDLTFRVQGPLGGAIDLIEQDAARNGRSFGGSLEGFEGKTEGSFKITVPLGEGSSNRDLKIEGRGRITEGRAKNVIATRDVQGATFTFDVSEQLLDLKGELLVGGVPSKLTWQRFFGSDDDRQPPLRLSATLDTADRAQLGIDLGGLVNGDVPVEVSVTPRTGSDPLIQVRGDLTNADLTIESLGWRKPPARPAHLMFDVAKATGRYKTELQGFKIQGDDINIEGTLWLDAQGRAREFNFPRFTLAVLSRLEMQGALKGDAWDVRVGGSSFDGREFFRSLYAVSNDKGGPRKEAQGLDLRAEIDTVLGHNEVSVRGLKMQLSKRGGKLTALTARGSVEGGGNAPKPIEATLQQPRPGERHLAINCDDAGQLFRLTDFYKSIQGGRLTLDVNLEGRGPAEKTGVLMVQRFAVLGDPVVSEVLQAPAEGGGAKRQVVRERLEFDWMRAPFSSGYGQFVLQDAELRGPLLGATLKGKADYQTNTVNLGGTYVPLQGLNSALGAIPGLGQILAGPKGEGVLGITFAIQGPMARPQVIVNPLSAVAPGIFREIFQMTNPTPTVTPRAPEPTPQPPAQRQVPKASAPRASAATDGWSSETQALPAKK